MLRHRTLTDLEGKDWGPPTYDSHLVTECHRLRTLSSQPWLYFALAVLILAHDHSF